MSHHLEDEMDICGCECGFYCVNHASKWCKNFDNKECSCIKGCLIYDTLMKPGESNIIYCKFCNCSVDALMGVAYCNGTAWCTPSHFIEDIHYPSDELELPNCKDYNNYYD
ncbi:hypothetical protein CHS0354_030993 [Potamilus streckersoni]|uniref:Uncharacterized protein n=1 Tax=Potamilus streckersoni TaxID=2493646 RepID=A0AAE0S2Z0_9BIVA|nr:hypothetical protein CHS0354_030993 [Potamilus streckersoni]